MRLEIIVAICLAVMGVMLGGVILLNTYEVAEEGPRYDVPLQASDS